MGWCEYYHTFCDDEEIEKKARRSRRTMLYRMSRM